MDSLTLALLLQQEDDELLEEVRKSALMQKVRKVS